MIYYFAYGSNLDQDQMEKRCPESRLVEKAVLEKYTLAFTTYSTKRNCGCADLVAIEGHEVWGLIYELSDADLKSLDKHEGANYRRIEVSVVNENGDTKKALTYVVITQRFDLKPSKDYLGIIMKGANDFNFPESYKKDLLLIDTL